MHKIFIFLLTLVIPAFSYSQISDKDWKKHLSKVEKSREKQGVEVSLDTLFYKGEPYCLFVEGKKMLGNVLDVTVKDLSGNDQMWCVLKTGTELFHPEITTAYEITFSQSESKSLYVNVIGNNLAKEIVKNGLFVQGIFQPEMERKFIAMNAPLQAIGDPGSDRNSGISYKMVERNRNAMVQVFGNAIKQDFVVIGNIKESQINSQGNILTRYTISLASGAVIAIAENEGINGHHWEVITMQDHKMHHVHSEIGKDQIDIINHLIKMLYL